MGHPESLSLIPYPKNNKDNKARNIQSSGLDWALVSPIIKSCSSYLEIGCITLHTNIIYSSMFAPVHKMLFLTITTMYIIN